MFTGIIRSLGTVEQFKQESQQALLRVKSSNAFSDAKLGDSVAINGTCLTIIEHDNDMALFELGPETLKKTNLSLLEPGVKVNMELPMQAKDRFGGHFVQGHVDSTGTITEIQDKENTRYMEIEAPEDLMKYIMLHGSIALDGVSLTVAKIKGNKISIMLMAYTLDHTNLKTKKVGDQLNIEVDMLAKYVKNLASPATS